jgi:hypothetical protein
VHQIFCPQCRLQQPVTHVYCLRCGEALPAHLLDAPAKRVGFFAGTPVEEGDPEGAFLRVSCYLREQKFTSPEGSVVIPGHHVRFSVWIGDAARCVLSIPETEARALAAFLADELGALDEANAMT